MDGGRGGHYILGWFSTDDSTSGTVTVDLYALTSTPRPLRLDTGSSIYAAAYQEIPGDSWEDKKQGLYVACLFASPWVPLSKDTRSLSWEVNTKTSAFYVLPLCFESGRGFQSKLVLGQERTNSKE